MDSDFLQSEPDKFNLDYQFFLYLKRIGLHWEDIPKGQYGELKRAFFGALGQMLMLVSMDMSKLSDEEASKKTVWMTEQISEFWKEEVQKHSRVNN
jgi:hypothetical protein